MGLMDPEPMGNGTETPKLKGKYTRMDGDVNGEDEESPQDLGRKRGGRSESEKYVFACAVFASLNNVLLGYDVGVMSGVILFMKEDLNISEVQQEVLVGCLSIMSLVGSLAGCRTADAVGRKWTIGLAAIVFQAGAAVMTFAPSFLVLMMGRVLAGVGIGLGVMVVPVYIAEISPTAARGTFTSFPEIFINRILPSVFIGFALFMIPESPRWLVMMGRVDEARSVLMKVSESEGEANRRLADIEAAAGGSNTGGHEEKAVWQQLLRPTPALRRMLITGFGIQCFQQITGIDATVYYSPTIFRDAGIESNAGNLAATIAVGVTKTAFILVAILLIDRVGRPHSSWMTACLFGLGLCLSLLGHELVSPKVVIALAILAVCGNVAFFSVGDRPSLLGVDVGDLPPKGSGSSVRAWGSREQAKQRARCHVLLVDV